MGHERSIKYPLNATNDPSVIDRFCAVSGDGPTFNDDEATEIGFERKSAEGKPLPTMSFAAGVITKLAKKCGHVPKRGVPRVPADAPLRRNIKELEETLVPSQEVHSFEYETVYMPRRN